MKKEIEVRVDSSEVLNRVSRMFDGTPRSILLELMQNARRAGATQIDISFLDETLTIAHDGLAFDDFDKLFSLGSSGWKDNGIKNEDPAGMGFFVSTLFESVEVLSRKDENSAYIVKATKDELTKESSKLHVNTVKFNHPAHNVEFRLRKGITVNDYHYRQVAHEFPVPSTFTGIINGHKETISEDYFLTAADKHDNPRLLERVVNGVRMFFQKVQTFSYTHENAVYFNYHGHHFCLYNDVDLLMRQVVKYDGVTLVVLPKEDSKLHLTLPARDSIVEDKTYFQMLEDIKVILADYVNTQESHDLAYKVYEQLGGAKKIHQEAAIPKALEKYWYSGDHNMNILFYDTDNILSYHLSPYKGYEWYLNYTELSEDNVALRIRKGKDISVIPLNALPAKENEPSSGLVDSLEVIHIKPEQESELITSLDQAVLLSEDNEHLYGYFEPYADRVWICKGANINKSLDYLEDCLGSFWESNSNGDADSWETQLEEFREALRDWWESVFLADDKERLSIGRAISKTRWRFNNATLMVINKDAVYLSGIAGDVVKLSEKDTASIRKIINIQGD